MKRKFVVDGQLFQTPAWHRGMGKYSLELLAPLLQMLADKKWDASDIVLSSKIKTDDEVISFIKEKLPLANIVFLDLIPDEISNKAVPRHNRAAITAYVKKQQEAGYTVDFLILSIMQGGIYPTFPDIDNVKRLVVLYDLIPLMFYDVYLRSSITQNEYIPRIGELLRADIYLAISKTVANDLALYLGVDKSRIVSIDGGPIQHSSFPEQVSVPGPFVLMPTGNDLRKNNQRAILGFEEFNKRNGNKYYLLITSFFKDHEIEQLSKLSSNVIFTGNISGGQLSYLYDTSSALLFPPEYEGLGMPILEALERDKPIACSNIAVFREMSTKAFHYFDPYSIVEIGDALERAIKAKAIDKKEYSAILSKYTWERSAKELLKVVEEPRTASNKPKSKIAVIGANPSNDNIAAKIMQENYAELSRLFTVDYYLDTYISDKEHRVNYLQYITDFHALGVGVSPSPNAYDHVIYHLDDAPEFALPLLYALGKSGIVVLHSLTLEKAWDGMIGRGFVGSGRVAAEDAIEAKYREDGTRHLASLLGHQQAIVVFSQEDKEKAENLLKKIGAVVPVHYLLLPVPTVVYEDALYEKTIGVVAAQEVRERVRSLTDFRTNMELGKVKAIVYDDISRPDDMLEALRFGVMALSGTASKQYGDIDQSYVHEVQKGSKIVEDDPAFQTKSIDAISYVQTKHSERMYVASLKTVLDNIAKVEVEENE